MADDNFVLVDFSGIFPPIVSLIRSLSDVDASTSEVRTDSFVFATDVRILLDAWATVSLALVDIRSAVSEARRKVLSFARSATWDAAVDADVAMEENRVVICDVALVLSVVVTMYGDDVALPTDDADFGDAEVGGGDDEDGCVDE